MGLRQNRYIPEVARLGSGLSPRMAGLELSEEVRRLLSRTLTKSHHFQGYEDMVSDQRYFRRFDAGEQV